jgi:hypothetical protein
MYQFSRAIYRELAPHLLPPKPDVAANANQEHLLQACEAVVERMAVERLYFARPERTLFCDIRSMFAMSEQGHVHRVVARYIALAQQFLIENPLAGYASISGEPPQCRATTRKGAACQRVPLPHNGYCPSHQHLADTEDRELAAA